MAVGRVAIAYAAAAVARGIKTEGVRELEKVQFVTPREGSRIFPWRPLSNFSSRFASILLVAVGLRLLPFSVCVNLNLCVNGTGGYTHRVNWFELGEGVRPHTWLSTGRSFYPLWIS